MKKFLVLSYSEFEKIISKRKSKGLLILLGIILIGAGILFYYVENTLNLTAMSGSQFPIWILNLLMGAFLPFFAAMAIADSISGEFDNGTIINLYVLPVSRQTIYTSKIVGSLLYLAIMLGITLGSSLLIALITSGFGVLSSIGLILATYLEALIAIGLVISFVSFIALWFRSSSMTLVISGVLFLGLNTLSLFLGSIRNLLPTTIIGSFDKIFSSNNNFLLVYVITYYIIIVILGIFKLQKKEV